MKRILKDTYWLIPPDKKMALYIAKRSVPDMVYDSVLLEGLDFTFPEIQTLLDGVTIGGKKISDQNIVLNQKEAWAYLLQMMEQNKFSLSSENACSIQGIAAKEEALTSGKFRNTAVFIQGTTYVPPVHEQLPGLYDKMLDDAEGFNDIYEKSFFIFLTMARTQFFHDGNKRTGRFMMNGLLIDNGYPPINVIAKRQQEFNTKMIDFYESNDMQSMFEFLRSCMNPQIKDMMTEHFMSQSTNNS